MLARIGLKVASKSIRSTGVKNLGASGRVLQRSYHSGVDNFSITQECKSAIERTLIPNEK